VDPTKLLEADHRKVESLFEAIDQAEGDDRRPLIDELTTSLRAHMRLEEDVVYPAMAPVTGDEAVEEGNEEHEIARSALQSMLDLAPDQPGFGAAMEATKAAIEHHVEEEENEVFPQLRKDGTVLDRIATPFMATRLELGLPVDAEALEAAATKDELLEEARAAGLEGVSSMDKHELAEALSAVMAGSAGG
jgi:hemerythrin superfamily protein